MSGSTVAELIAFLQTVPQDFTVTVLKEFKDSDVGKYNAWTDINFKNKKKRGISVNKNKTVSFGI